VDFVKEADVVSREEVDSYSSLPLGLPVEDLLAAGPLAEGRHVSPDSLQK
jgi:hypothetical protein